MKISFKKGFRSLSEKIKIVYTPIVSVENFGRLFFTQALYAASSFGSLQVNRFVYVHSDTEAA